MTGQNTPAPRAGGLIRLGLVLLSILAFAFAAHWLMDLIAHWVEVRVSPDRSDAVMAAIMIGTLILYALMIAVPFVPGIEVGVALMMMRGADVAPAVYVATVAGLSLAFLTGSRLSDQWLIKGFAALRLRRAEALIAGFAPLSRPQRLTALRHRLPGRLGDWMIRYRYVAAALLLNLPGSGMIGGGGGVCLIMGLSRLFGPLAGVLTIALAVLPVPMIVWLLGRAPWQ